MLTQWPLRTVMLINLSVLECILKDPLAFGLIHKKGPDMQKFLLLVHRAALPTSEGEY